MKKFISMIMILSAILCINTFAAKSVPTGDGDNDGRITLLDVFHAMSAVVKGDFSDENIKLYDTTGDGFLTLDDVLLILNRNIHNIHPSKCSLSGYTDHECVWDTLKAGEYCNFVYKSKTYDITMNYRVRIPSTYSPDKKYAIAAHFHGLGGEKRPISEISGGTYFNNILSSSYGSSTILVLPQCPVGMTWPNHKQTIEVAYEIIDMLATHLNVDRDRMYLSGHSNGSKGVAYMLEAHPNTFAAAVMGSGASPIANYKNLENIATASVWIFCGSEDSYGFQVHTRALYAALCDIGADVKYTEFEGLGHNIFSTVGNTSGLVNWIFSKSL